MIPRSASANSDQVSGHRGSRGDLGMVHRDGVGDRQCREGDRSALVEFVAKASPWVLSSACTVMDSEPPRAGGMAGPDSEPDSEPARRGNRLAEFRLAAELTQEKVADRLQEIAWRRFGREITPVREVVSAMEHGRKKVSPFYRTLFCELYQATPDDLGRSRMPPTCGKRQSHGMMATWTDANSCAMSSWPGRAQRQAVSCGSG
jgi:hypothetical protein